MLKHAEMTNKELYTTANVLLEAFTNDIVLPVKVNFYLTKNTNNLVTPAREIEAERAKIVQKYGTPTEDGESFNFTPENAEIAQKELDELFDLKQTVDIYTVSIDSFGDVELTQKQMNALMFMIEEEE